MIGSLSGKVKLKTEKYAILETGGVGYKVNLSPDALMRIGGETSLWIHTYVREDAIELYGFMEREEQNIFEMLLGVSGIGPKSALAIIGIAGAETLKKAVGSGDIAYLTKVSGIGKKTAEKIVIELRDKMKEDSGETSLKEEIDALEALRALGYGQNEAREALKKVEKGASANEKIKKALKILGNA